MNWYPQIGAGSIAQFPLSRSRRWRTIVNNLENGERIVLPDASAGQIGWKLSYQDLSDVEAQSLRGLFAGCQGGFGTFTFIDPLANLLGWSENLSQPSWQAGLLRVQAGVNDPLGTQRASTVSNPSAGAQALQQTLGISGAYVACFSAWVRSVTAATITLQRDSIQKTVAVGPSWTRVFLSGTGTAGAAQATFSILIGAGQSIDVLGMQAEAQPFPSGYKQTLGALGIYEETSFATDELTMTSTGAGLASCDVALISRV